ncbi:NAD-dependent epimerase/dehydratase family protein [Kiloniella laminariae]|uniref:NAD-dependent epimerase/dehydratase family protein n=1 Tax=Kiloniella laminariae TaxID=454162 RepID=UPI000382C2CB|nr:NAD-dependent epimerase/dehydratase family protein [Kiloniella laminariae]
MAVLVTGAAGFIGSTLIHALLNRGERVVGVDNLNDYYDVNLKKARLKRLEDRKGDFSFCKLDISDREALPALCEANPDIEGAVHLAAQAGVRYSLTNPFAYIEANSMGHLVVMEACRRLPNFKHLVYASSSSVYGGNTKMPFSVEDPVDNPVSLYAATKRSCELMSDCYAHLYRMPMTGLRFFTVYGPWGRPDMAAYLFTKAILEGKPIDVFNNGEMRRDFTYIDDIVSGVIAALDRVPAAPAPGRPHKVYNLGNNNTETLMDYISVIEEACGREAIKNFREMQPGDVKETYADIDISQRELGFEPKVKIREGLPKFVQWYRDYHKV